MLPYSRGKQLSERNQRKRRPCDISAHAALEIILNSEDGDHNSYRTDEERFRSFVHARKIIWTINDPDENFHLLLNIEVYCCFGQSGL
jgi:hypothetical protein